MCRKFFDDGCKAGPIRSVVCDLGDIICEAEEALNAVMRNLASEVSEDARKAAEAVGSMWLDTPRIEVVNGAAPPGQTAEPLDVGVHAGEQVGGATITTVLGWVMWIALGICVLSLMVAGARMAWHARAGGGQQHADRLGTILFATILITGAVGLVSGVVRPGDSEGSTTVAFIQNATWWYTVAFGAIGVFVAAIKMAWEQRADAGRDLLRSLLTLLVVSGIGLSMISYLQFVGDEFSKWIIGKSLDCKTVIADGKCLGDQMAGMLISKEQDALGIVMTIIFAIIALLVSLVQVALLIVRNGLLIVLGGVLPLSAAATNTAAGKQMFSKVTGWIIGFLLYKPVAAIIYAAAFKLASENKEDVILSIVTGTTLMVLSLIALPAMMTLIVPAVGSVTGGGGGAAAGIVAAALPTGAMMLSKGSGGGSSGGAGKGPSGAASAASSGGGPKGPSGNNAPTGGGNNGGGGAGSSSSGGGPQGAQGGSQGSSTSGGGSGGSSGASSGGSGPSGAASGGDQGGGAASSGGSAGSPSGGSPSGAGSSSSGGSNDSGATAMMVAQAGMQAVQAAADEATGAGGGPDGSQQQ